MLYGNAVYNMKWIPGSLSRPLPSLCNCHTAAFVATCGEAQAKLHVALLCAVSSTASPHIQKLSFVLLLSTSVSFSCAPFHVHVSRATLQLAFLIGSTFIAVYWPLSVQPDGGRAEIEGAGWVAIVVTWMVVLVIFFAADLAKTSAAMLFHKYGGWDYYIIAYVG